MRRRVVVTGGGALGPLGAGTVALLPAVLAGRTAIERTGRSCAAPVRGEPDAGPVPPNVWRRLDRCSRLAAAAVREALETAGLAGEGVAASASGLVLGTMTSGVRSLRAYLATLFPEGPESVSPMLFPFTVPNAPASQCSILFGLQGPNLTLSQMEASGLAAIATAADLVASGACDAAVAGGADERVEEFERAWTRLRLVFRGAPGDFPGPFGRGRRGFVPGEGAYFVVLESLEGARRRGATPWAEVAGTALGHAPGPAHGWPAGPEALAGAIGAALDLARLRPAGIGWVCAGANGSRVLDAVEAAALRRALGPAAPRVPVASMKGAVGESGCASACSALVGALSIRDGFVPPVAGLADPDPDLGLGLVVGKARRGRVETVLLSAPATGGGCAAVVLSRPAS